MFKCSPDEVAEAAAKLMSTLSTDPLLHTGDSRMTISFSESLGGRSSQDFAKQVDEAMAIE